MKSVPGTFHTFKQFSLSRFAPYGFLLLCILLSIGVRLRFQQLPLERDEGEYAYAGQLLQQGIPPYEGIYNMKFPGTYFCYALIEKFFGETVSAIRLSLLAVNLISIILFYFIARNWFMSRFSACIAAGYYSLLTLSDSVEGIIANAEQFVLLFALAGLLAAQIGLRRKNRQYIFFSGFFMGLAVIMKQHGFVFAGFAFIWLLTQKAENSSFSSKNLFHKLFAFTAGFLLPLVVLIVWLYQANVLQKFYELTFLYAHDYISQYKWSYAKNLLQLVDIFSSNPLIWIFSLSGMIMIWFVPGFKKKAILLWLLGVFSFLGVMPGFYFRPHYFNFILPAAALLAAASFFALKKYFPERKTVITVFFTLVIFVSSCYFNKSYYFQLSPSAQLKKMYPYAPFNATQQIGQYIKAHSSDSSRIGIIGSEPEIYFYSQRKSATSLMYIYPLVENQRFQEQMLQQFFAQLDSVQPEFLVFDDNISFRVKHLPGGDSVLRKYQRITNLEYTQCAIAEHAVEIYPIFRNANQNDSLQPMFKDRLLVLRRKDFLIVENGYSSSVLR